MTLRCRVTDTNFELNDIQSSILEKIQYQNSWIGNNIPYPKVLPEILVRQVAAYGNTINLYTGVSKISGAKQLSRFNPRFNKIVTLEEYFSDKVDNKIFAKKYNFNKSFFQQFSELLSECYLPPLTVLNCENCDYVNGSAFSKNCYLCFSIVSCQDCLYCYGVHNSSNCIDCNHSIECQYCYDCTNVFKCYQTFYSFECYNSRDLYACFNCRSCSDCIACSNLEYQSYCINNKKYSKEEYEIKKNEILNSNLLQKLVFDFYNKTDFNKCLTIINSEDASGAYIQNSKNVNLCFNTHDSQDCDLCYTAIKSNDCCFGFYYQQNLSYAGTVYQGFNNNFSYSVQNGEGNWYSFCLYNDCNHCFGSVGLKKDQYCILNQQYTKSEYFDLLPRIVEHMKKDNIWGEFLPTSNSIFSYDACLMDDFLEPIDEKWIEKIGFYRGNLPEEPKLDGKLLSDQTSFEKDIIVGMNLRCQESNKIYRIISQEFDFIKKFKLLFPHNHWKVRVKKRNSYRQRIPSLLLK